MKEDQYLMLKRVRRERRERGGEGRCREGGKNEEYFEVPDNTILAQLSAAGGLSCGAP